MGTVTEIIEAVKRLDERDKNLLLDRLLSLDFEDAWDHQIEADAKAGRLDTLWAEATKEVEDGKARPLNEVLDH